MVYSVNEDEISTGKRVENLLSQDAPPAVVMEPANLQIDSLERESSLFSRRDPHEY